MESKFINSVLNWGKEEWSQWITDVLSGQSLSIFPPRFRESNLLTLKEAYSLMQGDVKLQQEFKMGLAYLFSSIEIDYIDPEIMRGILQLIGITKPRHETRDNLRTKLKIRDFKNVGGENKKINGENLEQLALNALKEYGNGENEFIERFIFNTVEELIIDNHFNVRKLIRYWATLSSNPLASFRFLDQYFLYEKTLGWTKSDPIHFEMRFNRLLKESHSHEYLLYWLFEKKSDILKFKIPSSILLSGLSNLPQQESTLSSIVMDSMSKCIDIHMAESQVEDVYLTASKWILRVDFLSPADIVKELRNVLESKGIITINDTSSEQVSEKIIEVFIHVFAFWKHAYLYWTQNYEQGSQFPYLLVPNFKHSAQIDDDEPDEETFYMNLHDPQEHGADL